MKQIMIIFFSILSIGKLHSQMVNCPATITVGTSCSKHSCSSSSIEVVNFNTYTANVLTKEWGQWGAWVNGMQSLNAGAVAIRSYAINRINNPISDHSGYNICNTTYCHVYDHSIIPSSYATNAVSNTANYILTNVGGNAQLAEYAAETNDNCIPIQSSPNSNYCGQCGDGKFQRSVTGPPINSGACYPTSGTDAVCIGKANDGHPRGMCQRGSIRWASGYSVPSNSSMGSLHGYPTKTWQQTLSYYYPYWILSTCDGVSSTSPANDNCPGIQLTSLTSCNYLNNQTVNNATTSGKVKGSCDAASSPALADVWYQFTAQATSHTITVDPNGSELDAVIVVYSSCSGSEIACNDTQGGPGILSTLALSGLTVGNTYYARVYDYAQQTPNGGFRICVTHAAGEGSTACNTPAGTTESSITQTSASLSWGNVSSASEYRIRYRLAGTSTWTTIYTTNRPYSLIGLQCNTSYEWQVRSECSGGDNSSNSATRTFTTSNCTTSVNPCTSITSIEGCGSSYSQTFTGGGSGAWFTDTDNDCGYDSPGSETIYSFMAPSTGEYSIQVTTASGGGYVDYMWKSGSCNSSGWNCIADFNSTGTKGSMSWTAGTTYYILLDDENSNPGTHTFYINCPEVCNTPAATTESDITQTSASLSWDNVSSASEYRIRYRQAGASTWTTTYTTNRPYSLTGLQCNTSYEWQVRSECSGGDNSSNSATRTFTTSNCTTSVNPCTSITSIEGCGSSYSQTFTGGGSGAWFTDTDNDCGYDSPGSETIYSFMAPSTGEYSIQVTTASGGGYVDYMWKSGSCNSSGWNCIADVSSTGTKGSMSWTAGTNYYLLLDDENSSPGTHTFYINCPEVCSIPAGTTESGITQTSASLGWNDVSSASYYTLRYRVVNTSTWSTVNTSDRPHALGGLQCNTTYEWQVRANCSNFSDYSLIREFTTSGCSTSDCSNPTLSHTSSIHLPATVSVFPNSSAGIVVTAQANCNYTISGGCLTQSWFNLLSTPVSGTVNGVGQLRVGYSLTENTENSTRSCGLNINGTMFTITQNSCSYNFLPSSVAASPEGENGTFEVDTDPSCSWSFSQSSCGWIVFSQTNGTGATEINYSVQANSGSNQRSCTITLVDGQTLNITQAGSGCTVPPQPGTVSGNRSVCSGNSETYSVTPVSGATSYTWSLPSGWSGSSSTNIINAEVGTSNGGSITVVANNTCGNSTARTLDVGVNETPTVQINPANPTICLGEDGVLLQAIGNAQNFSWSPTNGLSSATGQLVTAKPTVTTTYTVTAESENCSSITTTTVFVGNLLTTPKVQVTRNCHLVAEQLPDVTYQWYFDNQPLNGETTRFHEAKNDGIYHVVITTRDNCTFESEKHQLKCLLLGINLKENLGVAVYPNPTNDEFHITFEVDKLRPVQIRLYSILGQLMITKTIYPVSNSINEILPVHTYLPGVYNLQVLIGQELYSSQKVIIK